MDGSVDASLDAGLDAVTPAPLDAGDAGTPPPPVADGLYVISSWVSANESGFAYVKTVPRIDTDTKVDIRKDSIEVGGFGDAKVLGDKLFVSDGEEPTITRYAIDAQGRFTKEQTLDFSLHAASAALYQVALVSPTIAYLTGDTGWVRWNPSTMAIEPELSVPFDAAIGEREGITPYYAYDRGFAVRGNYLFHAISWVEFDEYKMTPTSAIAVIDTSTSKLLSVLDAPCPGLDSATTDDAGNIYFSGWSYNPGATIINGAAKGCAVMIPSGQTTLSNFKLTFADVTGHEAVGLRYLGNNKFIMQVFDEKKSPYDASKMTISEWVFDTSWFFATYDAVTHEYKRLDALGYVGGGYYSELIDGKFYLLSRQESVTDYVELLPDGTGKKGITVDGWASRAYKIR